MTLLDLLELQTKWLIDPTATAEDRARYLEADRKCRELGLLPKTQSE